jgi:glycosyltransferase involved in cell wall biosynthesis
MHRLLSVNSYHYRRGGSDIVYLDHAALFGHRGWENFYFAMQHPDNLPYALDHYFAQRIDYGIEIGAKRQITNALRIIYSQDARSRLGALLDKHPVDIAHFHIIHHHLSPSVLVEARRRGIPTVMTAHDLKLACPNYKMMNMNGICERCKGGHVWNTLRYLCIKNSVKASSLIMVESAIHKASGIYSKNLSAIVAPSRFYQRKLLEWGWEPEKVHYIPNFVSVPAQVKSEEYGDHVLYFGRLAAEKGVATLIRASAATGVAVVVVGSGPEELTLRTLAEELEAPVIFRGFLTGDALWEEVGRCRAVILPSEWYENAPVSILESFVRGRPVAGACIGGIPELIEPGISGWHFRSKDVADLARTLIQIYQTSKAELTTMGVYARRFVEENFSQDRYYESMIGLYRQIS